MIAGAAHELRETEEILGYRFTDPGLLDQALTHRSHSHETTGPRGNHYERLEFLGDALLGFLVAAWLYGSDTDAPEGILSRRRQSVVRTATLAEAARRLGLGEAARLGRGEQRSGGRAKPSLLADLFEAVLGAIFLDGGIRAARAFVRRHLGETLLQVERGAEGADDYKTQLQEAVQAELRRTPHYRIVSTTGPAHALEFEVEVLIDGEVLGSGGGTTRKRAEQGAARAALLRLAERRKET